MNLLEDRNIIIKEQARLRKIEYNKNPHICKYCNKEILMTDQDKFNDVYKKEFCSRSCSSKYGHMIGGKKHIKKPSRIDTDFSDEELISFYKNSKSIKDLESKIGYKNILSQTRIIVRYTNLGIDLNNLKNRNVVIENLTKKELFERTGNYQNARSQIQKHARINYSNSNKPKKCVCCGYEKHYEVAHILAVSDFEDDALISEINNINNLIALCPNHHWEYDNTNLEISSYINK